MSVDDHPPIYLAIDPAMANTGVAMWCEGDKEISTVRIKPPTKVKKKDFRSVYLAGKEVTAQVGGMLRKVTMTGAEIHSMMEHPPPSGIWAAGLCLVDALLLSRLHRLKLAPYLAHPTRINTLLTAAEDPTLDKKLQRKTSFTKRERRDYLFEILEMNGMSWKKPPGSRPNKKMSYDEADASILLMYLIHNRHHRLNLPADFVKERWLLKEVQCHG